METWQWCYVHVSQDWVESLNFKVLYYIFEFWYFWLFLDFWPKSPILRGGGSSYSAKGVRCFYFNVTAVSCLTNLYGCAIIVKIRWPLSFTIVQGPAWCFFKKKRHFKIRLKSMEANILKHYIGFLPVDVNNVVVVWVEVLGVVVWSSGVLSTAVGDPVVNSFKENHILVQVLQLNRCNKLIGSIFPEQMRNFIRLIQTGYKKNTGS